MIEIIELCKAYGDHVVLKDINLDVHKGEVLNLIGFSGSGKSTLLKIVAGLEKANAGEIKLHSEKVGMCFQYSALFDSMTVLENIVFPLRDELKCGKICREAVREKALEKLQMVGLKPGVADLFPSELSGGMKKRVSFARAIIDDPEIILYDEPTAGLDPVASTIIEDIIHDLQGELGAASIVVTHQQSTIKRTADRVALLYNAAVVWLGTADELFDPKNPDKFAQQFRLGSIEGPMEAKH